MESTGKMRQAFTEVVESATTRFADATEDMRRTASSIRTELEETRAEIRKGVFEMPLEAKESTTAIRRAVSEQINALKELSEIVAKSGRNTDVSEARPAARPAAPAPRVANRRVVLPRRSPRRPKGVPLSPVLQGTRERYAGRRAARGDCPAAARGQRPAPQGGWVRDLLSERRAKRRPAVADAGPRPPPPSGRRCKWSNR